MRDKREGNKMNKISEASIFLAQEELNKFQLPTGYTAENLKKSKNYLLKILCFLLTSIREDNALTRPIFSLLLETIGKISNVQGYDIIVKVVDENADLNSLNISENNINSVILWENNIEKTIEDLMGFIFQDNAFMPQNGERKAYFHNESLVLTKVKLR